jgi:hypothetical protein
MNAEMKSRWPDELRAAGNLVFNHCSSSRAANMTIVGRRLRCRAEATKSVRCGVGCPGYVFKGRLGHRKSEVICADGQAVTACPRKAVVTDEASAERRYLLEAMVWI